MLSFKFKVPSNITFKSCFFFVFLKKDKRETSGLFNQRNKLKRYRQKSKSSKLFIQLKDKTYKFVDAGILSLIR